MLLLKIGCALSLLLLALICALLPLLMPRLQHNHRFFEYSELFARGVFLAVGLCHLLPDAMQNLHAFKPSLSVWLLVMLVIISLLGFMLLEKKTLHAFRRHLPHEQCWLAYVLVILLSIHSIFEGTSIGVAESMQDLLLIFVAIAAHKGIAAFALAINFHQQAIGLKRALRLVLLFACMTPLGIIFGSELSHLLSQHYLLLSTALFNAIATGTFIYIALCNQWHAPELSDSSRSLGNYLFFALGFGLMALLSVYV